MEINSQWIVIKAYSWSIEVVHAGNHRTGKAKARSQVRGQRGMYGKTLCQMK